MGRPLRSGFLGGLTDDESRRVLFGSVVGVGWALFMAGATTGALFLQTAAFFPILAFWGWRGYSLPRFPLGVPSFNIVFRDRLAEGEVMPDRFVGGVASRLDILV